MDQGCDGRLEFEEGEGAEGGDGEVVGEGEEEGVEEEGVHGKFWCGFGFSSHDCSDRALRSIALR